MPDLQGVAVATVTPFVPGGGLDLDFIGAQLDFLRAEGAHGIVPVGTNGEFPSLTFEEKRQLLTRSAEEKGDLFLIAGIGSSCMTECIRLADHAADAGADAALAVPPFYYRDAEPAGIVDFYRRILDEIELPLYLYNIPVYTGIEISDEMVAGLLGHPRLAGIKDTGDNIDRTREYVNRYPDLNIFNGSDLLVDQALAAGCTGVISGIANIFPALLRSAWDIARGERGDPDAAEKVRQVRTLIGSYPWVAASKYCLSLRGLPQLAVRPPQRELTPDQKAGLEEGLQRIGVI